MITCWDAREKLYPIFKKWQDRTYDKWDAYGEAFGLMDDGEVRLIDIMDAAHEIGIAPGVVLMRRKDYQIPCWNQPGKYWQQNLSGEPV